MPKSIAPSIPVGKLKTGDRQVSTVGSAVGDEPPDRWISIKRAAELLDVSEPTLWRWIKFRQDFPRPVKLSPGCTRLSLRQLQDYVQCLGAGQ